MKATWLCCMNSIHLLCLAWLASAIEVPVGDYMGCYRDELKPNKRALPYGQIIDKTMTTSKCQQECFSRGFPWAGMEYGEECYCGLDAPAHGKVEENRCTLKCAGDPNGVCGGLLALSVYKANGPIPHIATSDRCLLSLVMILKNEAHTIINTLKTIKDHVDRWYILDTGSTDGTQDRVQEYMKDKQGKLFEEPFVDYGATRNRILDLAKEQPNPCVFTIMLSADERVQNGAHLRSFLERVRHATGSMHGAYPVVMNSGMDFDSVRVARTDAMWRYVGRVHEYLTSPNKEWVDLYRPVPDVRVLFEATDDTRRYQSQYKILDVLLDDLRKNENDTRAMFYIARTYSTLQNHTAAMRYYEMLGQTSKWKPEAYHGQVMKHVEGIGIGMPWRERQAELLDAFAFKPDDMDALHLLAEDHFNSGRFHLAYLFALRAAQIPPPEDLQATQNVLLRDMTHLYEYEGNRLLGFAAERVGEFGQCVVSLRKVLKGRPADTFAERTLKACTAKLHEKGIPVPGEEPKAEPASDSVFTRLREAMRQKSGQGPNVQQGRGQGEAQADVKSSVPFQSRTDAVITVTTDCEMTAVENTLAYLLGATWSLNLIMAFVFRHEILLKLRTVLPRGGAGVHAD